jgi:hypothetical protein
LVEIWLEIVGVAAAVDYAVGIGGDFRSMRFLCRHTGLIVAFLALAPHAWSASVTIGASKDNTIFENVANRSAGGAAGVFVGTAGAQTSAAARRGLMAFDVAAAVPSGATIKGAELTLHLALTGGGMDQSISLHRLTVDWGEGNAGSSTPTVRTSGNGFTAVAGDATWNARFHTTTPWSNPGATGDFLPVASASTIVTDDVESPFTWLSTPAMVADVQTWLDNPAMNFGWLLINADEVNIGTAMAFYSRSATVNAGGDPLDLTARPALTITYVPEPAAGILVLSIWPLMFARRARRNKNGREQQQ